MGSLANRNIPLFIAFRVFFNARWYYPVMAVLFLKLGLTLEQYALLNVVWAVSIVCLEVPSGALADRIGRRRILVVAAILMVLEMGLFAFAPQGSWLLFPMLLLNRLFSGAAEACASGADESLAYDSLRAEGREAEWPAVLTRLMRWQSAAFFATMLLGAALYDPLLVQHALACVGIDTPVSGTTTMRWPLYLSLGNAIIVAIVVLQMREPALPPASSALPVRDAWRQIVESGRWILQTHLVFLIILAGLCIDSVVRLFFTLCSNYYKLIGLPEASFGAIAAGLAVCGFFTPRLSQRLVASSPMPVNFLLVAAIAFTGLCLAAPFWRFWGLLAILPLSVAMSMLQFFLSHYLNQRVTDSSQRATVLSFKGLSFNLAYGVMGLLFAAFTRANERAGSQDEIFMAAFRWLPWFFAALVAVPVVFWSAKQSRAGRD